MGKIAIVTSEFLIKHAGAPSHPERPQRLQRILEFITSNKEDFEIYEPVEATDEDILSVHSPELLDVIKTPAGDTFTMLEEDTYVNPYSLSVARMAAGAGKIAIDLVANESKKRVFCAVRPPGHHAEKSKPMGFCLINNIALAAEYAINKYGLERIAIVDFDVHHGNGTQDIFYFRDDVFFISLHQSPLYPGTGKENETGKELGYGYNLNFPLPAYTKGEKYLEIIENSIIPKLKSYKPQLVLLSSGFDAHIDDPLANMYLTAEDYSEITKRFVVFTEELDIPLVSFLEGGYNLDALVDSVASHLTALSGKN